MFLLAANAALGFIDARTFWWTFLPGLVIFILFCAWVIWNYQKNRGKSEDPVSLFENNHFVYGGSAILLILEILNQKFSILNLPFSTMYNDGYNLFAWVAIMFSAISIITIMLVRSLNEDNVSFASILMSVLILNFVAPFGPIGRIFVAIFDPTSIGAAGLFYSLGIHFIDIVLPLQFVVTFGLTLVISKYLK